MPDGPRFVGRWVAAGVGRGFRVAEADDVAPFRSRVARWCDLAGFEIVPVAPGKDAAAVLDGRL